MGDGRMRRVARRGAIGVAGAAVLAYGAAIGATFLPTAERVAPEVWRTRDARAVAAAVTAERARAEAGGAWWEDGSAREGALGGPGGREAPVPGLVDGSAPPGALDAARRWVGAIQVTAPGAFLWAEVDAFGTLYLVPNAWWGGLTPDQRMVWTDQYGKRWRDYLRGRFGAWDRSEGFAPGIVVVDTLGKAAASIDDSVRVWR